MLTYNQLQKDNNAIEIKKLTEPSNTKLSIFIAKYNQFIVSFTSGVSCVLISYILLCAMESTTTPSIQYLSNAWSSVCYALVAAPPLIRIPLFILSVVSFCLWAHSTPVINFIDVSCIYWSIIAVTIQLLPNAQHNRIVLIFLDTGFILVLLTMTFLNRSTEILNYYQDNLVSITGIIYSLCGIIICSFYMTNQTFIIGLACISFGFICKLLTMFQAQYWGTAIFHMLSAIGIQILLKLEKQ